MIFVMILFGLGVFALYMGWRVRKGKTKAGAVEMAYMKISLPLFGSHSVVCSLIGGVCLYFENDFGLIYSFCLWGGVLVVGLGVLQICKIYVCTQQVVATCIGYHTARGAKGGTVYSPELRYTVANESYSGLTDAGYLTEKRMKKHYKQWEKYQIWIYPQYPNWFVTDKKIHVRSMVWISIGLLMLFAPLYTLIN